MKSQYLVFLVTHTWGVHPSQSRLSMARCLKLEACKVAAELISRRSKCLGLINLVSQLGQLGQLSQGVVLGGCLSLN